MGEIKQELGFDAAQALSALASLDKHMASFEARLGQSVRAMDGFNKKGGNTVSLLKILTTEAGKAATALSKVAALSNQVGSGGGRGPSGPAAPSGGTAASIDSQIKQLDKLFAATDGMSKQQARAYRSAITSAAEFATKNKISLGKVADQSKNLEKSFTGAANTMANKLAKIDAASKRHLNSAGQSIRGLTVDWQTMVRIVATQAIVRVMSQLRNVIRGAIGDAVEFQTRIAEIGTIAPVGELGDFADRVREISNEFNTPLDTTAKGYYQTISNQIGQTTDEFDKFVAASAKFSKTSVTNLAAAVNLGSGALNSYGKSAEDAEEVFAKFFITIRQGRLVGEELAQGLGTISPIAAKLGVDMDEVNAALATVTIQGISADKAFTQLRGVFNSFLKPTKEMSAALKEVGFATGEDILQAHDLQTALRLVAGETDGTAEGLSKLIPRIRGLTGALSLIDDESEHFTVTMEAQRNALQETYDRAYKLIIDTDANKATKELNKLKNFLTTEFGPAILDSTVAWSEWAGGAEGAITLMTSFGNVAPVVIGATVAIGAALLVMAARAHIATVGFAGLMTSMGGLGFAIAALGAATLGDFLGGQVVNAWDAEFQAFSDVMDKELELRNLKVKKEIALEKLKSKEMIQLFAQQLGEQQKGFFKITAASVETNKSILDDVKFYTNGVIQEAQRAAQASKSALQNLGKSILSSEKRVNKLRTNLEDRLFSRRISNQEGIQKVFALTERSSDLASSAAQKLSRATTSDQRASAEDEFRRAQAFAEQALSIADTTDNRVLGLKAVQNLESLTNKNIVAEKAYQQSVAQSQQAILQRAKAQEKNVNDLKVKQGELLDAYTLFDKETGELLTGKERTDKLKGAQKSLLEFIKLSAKGKPLEVGDLLSFASLSTQIGSELDSFRINEILASDQALRNLNKQVSDSLASRLRDVPAAAALQQLTGFDNTGIRSEREALAGLEAEQDSLTQSKRAFILASEKEVILTAKLAGALSDLKLSSQSVSVALSRDATKIVGAGQFDFFKELVDAVHVMNVAAGGGAVSMDELRSSVEGLQAAAKEQGFVSNFLTGNLKTDAENALLVLKELIDIRAKAQQIKLDTPGERSFEGVLERLNEIKRVGGAALNAPKQAAQDMNTALGSAATSTASMVSPTQRLASQWSSIARSAQLTAAASQTVSLPAFAASGGPVRHLASGGFARGTDQVPAMLTAGEHVTNAKSSRKFASQLIAMGAGAQPVFRESGGTVTNIGDVSISVTETKSARSTAREVMNEIRRETRRGSGRT